MKTILGFFYATVFVLTFVVGVTAVAGGRFALSLFVPSKTEATEQAVLALPNDDFPAEPSLVETQPEIFDAGDNYYFQEDNFPKAFEDLEFIEIVTHEYLKGNDLRYFAKPIVPTGSLHAGKDFQFKSITISDREITFETRAINGISYKFVGHFPKSPKFEYCDGCEILPDLKGKLTKLKNGNVVAETNADFYTAVC